jgi:RNA polymerase sigma-70 factor (ECF subfamily)
MPFVMTRSPAWLALSWRAMLLPSQPFSALTTAAAAPDPRVAAAARGDRVAAQSLCAELLPRVRNLVRYLVRGDSDVDDIAQDALIAVLRGLGSYRAEGSFKSWVDRIVARTTFANIKARRAQAAAHSNESPELLAVPGEGQSDAYVLRRQLARLLDGLPEEQRHVLVLHHAMGMTVPEIAEATGAPFETVRSRLRLGMASLRDVMEPGGERP